MIRLQAGVEFAVFDLPTFALSTKPGVKIFLVSSELVKKQCIMNSEKASLQNRNTALSA